jgi:TolB protein
MRLIVAWVLRIAVTFLAAGTLVVTQAGSGRTQTAPDQLGDNTYPVWSPTGQLIAFVPTKLKREIFVANPDGSGVRQLTRGGPDVESYAPAWSPDGRAIAFTSFLAGNQELFVMAADGGHERSVTPGVHWVDGFSWAPDSRRIVFWTRTTEPPIKLHFQNIPEPLVTDYDLLQIHVTSVDGGTPKVLMKPASFPTRGNADTLMSLAFGGVGDWQAAWSPDGSRIAFVSTRDLPKQIYTINSDGSSQKRLTSAGDNSAPVWSPDGRRIAFLSNRDGIDRIYIMNADGSQQIRLTSRDLGSGQSGPVWSPEGRRIAYASKNPSWKIYVTNSDGSGEPQLVLGP